MKRRNNQNDYAIRTSTTFALLIVSAFALPVNADNNVPLAVSAMELERVRLAEIVRGIDQLMLQVEQASHTGASGRVQFNYDALRRDLLGRRELIQRFINGSWDAPREMAPLASTYNR